MNYVDGHVMALQPVNMDLLIMRELEEDRGDMAECISDNPQFVV